MMNGPDRGAAHGFLSAGIAEPAVGAEEVEQGLAIARLEVLQDGWDARYAAAAPAREETEERAAQARTTHLNATSARTEGWDARWAARQQAAMTP